MNRADFGKWRQAIDKGEWKTFPAMSRRLNGGVKNSDAERSESEQRKTAICGGLSISRYNDLLDGRSGLSFSPPPEEAHRT